MKKLNRTEIVTLAKRILEEVNEVNEKYNKSIINSKVYQDEVEKIKSQDPTLKVKAEIEKLLKVEFGSKYETKVGFTVSSKDEIINNKINKELVDLRIKSIKPIYHIKNSDWESMPREMQKVIDDITIAQIDITDTHMLINTIKAGLL